MESHFQLDPSWTHNPRLESSPQRKSLYAAVATLDTPFSARAMEATLEDVDKANYRTSHIMVPIRPD